MEGILAAGLVVTSVGTLLGPKQDTVWDSSYSWLGIVLAIVATLFIAVQYTFEEHLFTKYRCSPVKVIGIEGAMGSVMGAICVGIANATRFESLVETIYQITHHSGLLAVNIILPFTTSTSMIAGLLVTQLGSSLLRSVLGPLMTVMLFCLEVTALRWATFEALTCAGLVVAVFGIMFFNSLIVCCPGVARRSLDEPVMFCGLSNPDQADEIDCVTRTESTQQELQVRNKRSEGQAV